MALRLPRISSCVLQCSRPLQGESSEEKAIQAVGAADRGNLESGSFPLLSRGDPLKEKGSSDLIIVFSKSASRPPVNRSAERSLQETCVSTL